MSTFKVRIEDLVGSVGDDAALSDFLTEGGRIVIDHLAVKGSDKLDLYATDKTDTGAGTGVDITGGRPLSAHKSYYDAKRIPVEGKARAIDADSNHYSTTTDPSWYIEKTKAYVVPSGGVIRWAGYPTVAFGDSSITNFPPEAYHTVVLYAAIMGQSRIISDLVKTTLGGLTFSIVSTIPTVGSPTFTYTKPTFGGSYTNITTHLTNQDVELAKGEADKLALQIQEWSNDLQNELNEHNSDVAEYQAALGEANAELANYSAEVNKEVGRIQSLTGVYTSTYQGHFQNLANIKAEFERSLSTL